MTLVEVNDIGVAKVCCGTGLGMSHGWQVYMETGTLIGEQRTERAFRFDDVFLPLRPTFTDWQRSPIGFGGSADTNMTSSSSLLVFLDLLFVLVKCSSILRGSIGLMLP